MTHPQFQPCLPEREVWAEVEAKDEEEEERGRKSSPLRGGSQPGSQRRGLPKPTGKEPCEGGRAPAPGLAKALRPGQQPHRAALTACASQAARGAL